jgi:hypothetical protein
MKKDTYEFVKEQIENEGYELLSENYIGSNSKLEVKCNKGHIYHPTFWSFKKGHRCRICGNEKSHNTRRLSYDYVKEQIENEGYVLLSKEYVNTTSILSVKCNKGHESLITYGNFQQGKRCISCCGREKLSYDYVKEQIENEGYILLSKEYVNAQSPINIKCNNNHKYKVRWYNFQQGKRCPNCDREKTSSKAEKEIQSFLSDRISFLPNDRTQILNPKTGFNLELDIWIPSLNKAIEFNGEYWHSLDMIKEKDIIKIKQCQEKGIDLLVINESDWINNKYCCFDKIEDFIDVNRNS